MKILNKVQKKLRRHARVRAIIAGSRNQPRVSVFRSNRYLFVQLIDDEKRVSLMGLSDQKFASSETNKIKRAFAFGRKVAEEGLKKHIQTVVFDRGGYKYHGRIKALAQGLREGGLRF